MTPSRAPLSQVHMKSLAASFTVFLPERERDEGMKGWREDEVGGGFRH
jgi:hypothetical protein